MWIEMVSAMSSELGLSAPADPEDLVRVETDLGQSVPTELLALLGETDGISDAYGTEFVWSVEQLIARNKEMRESPDFRNLYMPFDSLLFFGDNGGGDQFAFVRGPIRPDVFVWQHESDSRLWVARDLRDYLERFLEADGVDWYDA